ncbi:MAG: protein-tyrosine-phosphatase [Ahrensia sp.]|nr:protein-tyrosine-phosphatase [Ahrensia sp.]
MVGAAVHPVNALPGDQDTQLPQPTSVLFLCNHNIIRSPMAEAVTRARYGNRLFAASAGVRTGTQDAFVGAVMLEIGIDIVGREPVAIDTLDDTWFDLIVTLSPTAHHLALKMDHVEANEVEYWPSADPTVVQGSRDQRLAAYRDVRDRLFERIEERFGKL